ncbi:MAG: HD domain-containing protein [Pseudomonadales bacterium]|nr:HD domain-containing protein [Pseudomonadales bacterium]NRA17529.1 HD domain-containing protein [Oceanospirillaceae bacterium]
MFKVTKLLLIHDLVEIDAGDTWLYDAEQTSKFEDETRAARRLFSLLPNDQKIEYINLWKKFGNRSTEQAKFAAIFDGI